MNMPKALSVRIYSAELTAAAWINTRRIGRRITLAWYHRATAPRVAAAAAAALFATVLFPSADSSIVLLLAAAAAYTAIADKSHEVIDEENRPCPHCPAGDDRGGNGGVWLNVGWDDIPPAPAPMPDYDDTQIHDWAGRADQWLLELTAETRRANDGGVL